MALFQRHRVEQAVPMAPLKGKQNNIDYERTLLFKYVQSHMLVSHVHVLFKEGVWHFVGRWGELLPFTVSFRVLLELGHVSIHGSPTFQTRFQKPHTLDPQPRLETLQ